MGIPPHQQNIGLCQPAFNISLTMVCFSQCQLPACQTLRMSTALSQNNTWALGTEYDPTISELYVCLIRPTWLLINHQAIHELIISQFMVVPSNIWKQTSNFGEQSYHEVLESVVLRLLLKRSPGFYNLPEKVYITPSPMGVDYITPQPIKRSISPPELSKTD